MNDLADFVRVRRLRLDPATCGIELGGSQRRRVRGLRREELGQLAGLSADWIARLEQGRTTRLSRAAVERLTDVLRLDAVEAGHLLVLCGQADIKPAAPRRSSETLNQIVDSHGSSPVYVTNLQGDVLIWNAAANLVFGAFERDGETKSNALRWMFLSSTARDRLPDWREHASRMVAQFRFDYDRREKTASDLEFIARLRSRSTDFDRLWAEHEVLQRTEGRKVVRHPLYGNLVFNHGSFRSFEQPDLTMTIFVPVLAESPGFSGVLRDLSGTAAHAPSNINVTGQGLL